MPRFLASFRPLPFSAVLCAAALVFMGCSNPTAPATRSTSGTPGVTYPTGPVAHGEGIRLGDPRLTGWAVTVHGAGHVAGAGAPSSGATASPSSATGAASGVSTDVLVLGEGGSVTLDMGRFIPYGQGAGFAVFENGFETAGGLFAELAYVEVSSDGEHFARFPVATTRTTPVGEYEAVDPAQYSGFAGLHPAGTGTAFDLTELANHEAVTGGSVNLNQIRYIRIVDVIGSGTELDNSDPRLPIYDPYPQDLSFGTAGFDLDGVGIIEAN